VFDITRRGVQARREKNSSPYLACPPRRVFLLYFNRISLYYFTEHRGVYFYSISIVFQNGYFKTVLVFQCELVFRRRVSCQFFKGFVKRASMGKKASQGQGINGMRIQIT
jgi:hypothetical protein